MDDEAKIEYIRYGFSEATLLGEASAERVDPEACKLKFERLCRDALSNAFPDASIDILIASDLRTRVNGLMDSPEVDTVEQICSEVWQSYEWEVPRVWLDSIAARSRFGVPVSLIRWACRMGLVKEADKSRGYWEFPQTAFLDAMKVLAFADCRDVIAFKATGDGQFESDQCLSYDELANGRTDIAIGTMLLIMLGDTLERPPWFTSDNTCVLVSVESDTITLQIEHFVDADPTVWKDSKWSYEAFANSLLSQANQSHGIQCNPENFVGSGRPRIDGLVFRLGFGRDLSSELQKIIAAALDAVGALAKDVEIELAGGPRWREEYEKDEALFCREIVGPVLRRMGFLDVRYAHGVSEFGKDFTFSEMTKFHELRHCALQAKAGNVRGGVNSEIDEILGQIQDAFEIPYSVLGDDYLKHISTFIVAISGSFTGNAQVKIVNKMPKCLVGSVHFLDKERILGLISRYWSQTM